MHGWEGVLDVMIIEFGIYMSCVYTEGYKWDMLLLEHQHHFIILSNNSLVIELNFHCSQRYKDFSSKGRIS